MIEQFNCSNNSFTHRFNLLLYSGYFRTIRCLPGYKKIIFIGVILLLVVIKIFAERRLIDVFHGRKNGND